VTEQTTIKIGSWSVRPALNLLERGDLSVKIEPRTMDVLVRLAQAHGDVVPVDELLRSVWKGVVVGDGSVYLAIKQLRRALAVPGDDKPYIETIPKRGYRLVAPVAFAAENSTSQERRASETADTQAPPPPVAETGAQPMHSRRPAWLLGASFVLALVVAAAAATFGARRQPLADSEMRLAFDAPGYASDGVAISPDGLWFAYEAITNGVQRIWIRPANSFDAWPLPGTEHGHNPFWSPDARRLAFFADAKLKTIDVSSGTVRTVADARPGVQPAGSWARDGTILFTTQSPPSDGWHIARVPAAGGDVVPVTDAGSSPHNTVHFAPRLLPDGEHFLYVDAHPMGTAPVLYAGSLTAATRVPLMTLSESSVNPPIRGASVAFADGFLLYLREEKLLAQPFAVDRMALHGEAIAIADGVAEFSVSSTGVLVYRPVGRKLTPTRRLAWYDRNGRRLSEIDGPPSYRLPRLSPDGRSILLTVPPVERSGAEDVWRIDTSNGMTTRLTSHEAYDGGAVWSPDGRRFAFNSGRDGTPYVPSSLYVRNADGSGSEQRLFAGTAEELVIPYDWSPDGRYILFGRATLALTTSDIWAMPISGGDGQAFPLITSPFAKGDARLSPDGRWLVYATNESNGPQIVVRPFPDVDGGQWQVSVHGGTNPRWRSDGQELYWLDPEAQSWPWTCAPPRRASSSVHRALSLPPAARPRSGPTISTTLSTASGF